MTRPASKRRALLRELRAIRSTLQDTCRRWDVAGTVWEKHVINGRSGAHSRPRRPDEYPENQAGMWALTWNDLDEVIKILEPLREQALKEYQRLRSNGGPE